MILCFFMDWQWNHKVGGYLIPKMGCRWEWILYDPLQSPFWYLLEIQTFLIVLKSESKTKKKQKYFEAKTKSRKYQGHYG